MKARGMELRDALLLRKTALFERWKKSGNRTFYGEMEAVVKNLEALVRELDATIDDLRERARNWRFVGDSYFEMSGGTDAVQLKKSLTAYEAAKSLLSGVEAPAERMELHSCCGDVLYGLSDGKDTETLRKARHEYHQALEIAPPGSDATARGVERAVAMVDTLVALLEERSDLWRRISDRKRIAAGSSAEDFDLNIEIPEDAALFTRLLDIHQRVSRATQEPHGSRRPA